MKDFKETKLQKGPNGIPKELDSYEVIEHKIGNQTNAIENNNKFFSLELWKVSSEWYCYSNYGRVDGQEYSGVCGLYGPSDEHDMRAFFESKFKSKVRPSKGYLEIKFIKSGVGSPKARLKTYGVSEDEVPNDKKKTIVKESKTTVKAAVSLHPDIQRLVKQWYADSSQAITSNSAVSITSNGLETPLGVLTFAQLDKGRTILGELGQAVKDDKKKDIKKLTGAFYTHIPTKLGRKITDEDLISTDALIQQKLDLIGMMEDALTVGGKTYTSDIDAKYLELGIKAEFLSKSDPEWIRLEKKVRETKGSTHYGVTDKVLNVLKIEMTSDRYRYTNCKINNEQELFHGSRSCNIAGILKNGMKIAPKEAPRSGLAFGRGAYFARESSKSIQYSLYPFPGVEKSKNCFVFIFNVKLGKQLIKKWGNGNEHEECYKNKFDSTWGKAGNGLIYDEYIIYDVAQCTGCYLIELQR